MSRIVIPPAGTNLEDNPVAAMVRTQSAPGQNYQTNITAAVLNRQAANSDISTAPVTFTHVPVSMTEPAIAMVLPTLSSVNLAMGSSISIAQQQQPQPRPQHLQNLPPPAPLPPVRSVPKSSPRPAYDDNAFMMFASKPDESPEDILSRVRRKRKHEPAQPSPPQSAGRASISKRAPPRSALNRFISSEMSAPPSSPMRPTDRDREADENEEQEEEAGAGPPMMVQEFPTETLPDVNAVPINMLPDSEASHMDPSVRKKLRRSVTKANLEVPLTRTEYDKETAKVLFEIDHFGHKYGLDVHDVIEHSPPYPLAWLRQYRSKIKKLATMPQQVKLYGTVLKGAVYGIEFLNKKTGGKLPPGKCAGLSQVVSDHMSIFDDCFEEMHMNTFDAIDRYPSWLKAIIVFCILYIAVNVTNFMCDATGTRPPGGNTSGANIMADMLCSVIGQPHVDVAQPRQSSPTVAYNVPSFNTQPILSGMSAMSPRPPPPPPLDSVLPHAASRVPPPVSAVSGKSDAELLVERVQAERKRQSADDSEDEDEDESSEASDNGNE